MVLATGEAVVAAAPMAPAGGAQAADPSVGVLSSVAVIIELVTIVSFSGGRTASRPSWAVEARPRRAPS